MAGRRQRCECVDDVGLAVVFWRRFLREGSCKCHVKNSNPSRHARNRHIGVTHHEIAMCAYGIWEQEGRPEGRALDHWLQAELQLVLSSVWRNDFQGDALEKTRPIVRTRPFSVLPRPEPISAQLTSIVPLANDSKT